MFGHLLIHLLGHNSRAYQFFNVMLLVFFVALLPLGAVTGLSVFAWHEFAKEASYHRRFGEDWKAHYEADQGSMSAARTKVAVAVLATVANAGIGVWLYRQLVPALRGEGNASSSSGRRRRRRRS